MIGDTQLPKFDADNWVKVARFAVAASVVLSAVTVAILLMFDPPNQCPNWHLKDAHSTPLWLFFAGWTMPMIVSAVSLPFAGIGSRGGRLKLKGEKCQRCSAL